MESRPSAVSVILPANNDAMISATPMAASVITDCLAARCPLFKIAMPSCVLLLGSMLNVESNLIEIYHIVF